MEQAQKKHLLIGCTGSVAATRIDEIIEALLETGKYEIKVIFTKKAQIFAKDVIFDFDEYQKKNGVQFYYHNDHWKRYTTDKNNPLVMELIKWADLVLISPLSGNTLAKLANGLSDNLLVKFDSIIYY